MDSFALLNDAVKRWAWQQGWSSLHPVQQNAIPEVIGADRDVVIAAPTAGGKTEAAYLPIFSNLLDHPVKDGYAVLNLSPLKALINDQHQRLGQMASPMGIDVTPWHGDVSSSVKAASRKSPSGVLLITPESLEAMFVNNPHSLETTFKNLRYVVIDELHAFMGSERGIQLQSLLARIEKLIGHKVPRIGLSATLADYAAAQEFLRPQRGDYPVAVPDAGSQGHPTKVLIKEFTADGAMQFDEFVANDLYKNLRGSNNLIFANSRKEAEALALRLEDMSQDRSVPNEFKLHHGSLSKTNRHLLEKTLKKGLHPVSAICTSTLELGIDIGKVESIAQLVTANSVSSLRQRLGRSGRRGTPSVLRIYSMDEQRDDYRFHLRTNLVQNIAVVELLRESRFEVPQADVPHYSTLIQQILSLTAQYGSFYPLEAYDLLCRSGVFGNVSADEFLEILKSLGAKRVLSQTGAGQIVIGEEGEKIVKGHDFYTAFVTLQDLNVIDKSNGRSVGAVQYKPYVGEYILLAAQRWLVEAVDDATGQVTVSPAHTTGKMMFEGYGQELDAMITRKMREIYESDAEYPYLDAHTGAREALESARKYYRDMGLAQNPWVTIGDQRLLFTFGGMKMNRTLALIRKAEGQAMPAYDGIAVEGVTPSQAERLLAGKVDVAALAREVSRGRKMTEKYDYLLPDRLLDKKYAASRLQPVPAVP